MAPPGVEKNISAIKILLLTSNAVAFGLLLLVAVHDNFLGEWRSHQRSYKKLLVASAQDEVSKKTAQRFRIGIKQLYLDQGGKIDRCITCHVSIDDPKMATAAQPLRSHPGDYLDNHNIDKIGCTVCHEGQGRATLTADAHGETEHWERPMLRGKQVYTSCGKCHFENDLFGAEQDLYSGHDPTRPIFQAELESSLANCEDLARGKALFIESGCLGCHRYRGKGGTLAPDITHAGDLDKHHYDFSHVEGEHTPKQWLVEHFLNPEEISPGSVMPVFGFTHPQAEDLATYILSMHDKKKQPAGMIPIPKSHSGPLASGKSLFGVFCAACHGPEASKGLENPGYVNTTVPQLDTLAERMMLFEMEDAEVVIDALTEGIDLKTLEDDPPMPRFNVVLAQYDSIFQTIKEGSIAGKKDSDSPEPPYHMPGWEERLTNQEINAVIAYLLTLYPWEEDEE